MLLSALALGASSAAAAGYVALQSNKEPAAAVSDSSHVVAEAPDTAEQHAEPPDSVTATLDSSGTETPIEVAIVDSSMATPDGGCPTVLLASESQPVSAPEPAGPDPEAQRQAYRQVARILANMGDSEVAQLLAHIDDAEIEVILRNVTAREGARILSQLSGERAAELSRRLLVAATDSRSEN